VRKCIILLAVIPIVALTGYILEQSDAPGQIVPDFVFLKTYEIPEGKSFLIVSQDDAAAIQWWHHTDGNYYVLHADKRVTYVDAETLARMVPHE
jgi:hypothetical protein